MSAHLVVRDLHKSYGNVPALRGVDFTVERGEVFGLLGPNGAGKTTTVECVSGLRAADRGAIVLGDLDARAHPRDVRQRIGVALQTTSLPDKITPREALRLFGAFYRRRVAPAALLERFSLVGKADARVETLSGGQRQRLALALAFVNGPELVLLDEPTTGLDPQARRDVREEIARMKRDGHTVLLTTHDLEEAEQVCDRVAIVDRGQVVATGAPRALIARSGGWQTIVATTVRPLDRARLAALPAVREVEVEGATLTLRTNRVTETLAALAQAIEADGAELVELKVRKATLEDVFIGLTGGEGAP